MSVIGDFDAAVVTFVDDLLASNSGTLKRIKRAPFRSAAELFERVPDYQIPMPCGVLSFPDGIGRGENRSAGPAARVDFDCIYRFGIVNATKKNPAAAVVAIYNNMDLIFTNVWDQQITSGETSGWGFDFVGASGWEIEMTEELIAAVFEFQVRARKAAT